MLQRLTASFFLLTPLTDVIEFLVSLIMKVAVLSFLSDGVIDTKCRLSIEMKIMLSTDYSMGEHESGKASKIRVLVMI